MSISPGNRELPADSIQLPAADIVDKYQWLKFNVGGVLLETTRASIDELKSEFFAMLLDADPLEFPGYGIKGDVYRIDRDPEALRVFFNYGRYGKIVSIPDHISQTFLEEEGTFYKVDDKIIRDLKKYYEERSKGPSSVHLERVRITEMTMNKNMMHHNVYGVLKGTNILCFTKVLGKGSCHKDVTSNFIFETPRPKYPSLFRATCHRCSHKIYMADDPLIGLEGWCHKCARCLKCQDILCESNRADVPGTSADGNNIIRKTAQVVFVQEEDSSPRPLLLHQEAVYNPSIIRETAPEDTDDGVEQDGSRDHAILQGQSRMKSVVDESLNLPKLPRLKINAPARDSTQQFFPAIKPNLRRSSLPARSSLESVRSFEEFLLNGKW